MLVSTLIEVITHTFPVYVFFFTNYYFKKKSEKIPIFMEPASL